MKRTIVSLSLITSSTLLFGAPTAQPVKADGSGAAAAIGGLFLVGLILLGIAAYFLPSIIAGSRKKRNAAAIFVLNLLAGWTLIGWVGALVWSLLHDETPPNAAAV